MSDKSRKNEKYRWSLANSLVQDKLRFYLHVGNRLCDNFFRRQGHELVITRVNWLVDMDCHGY